MPYKRKTEDYYKIYISTQYGWEFLTQDNTRKEARQTIKTYQENMPALYKIIKKREKCNK